MFCSLFHPMSFLNFFFWREILGKARRKLHSFTALLQAPWPSQSSFIQFWLKPSTPVLRSCSHHSVPLFPLRNAPAEIWNLSAEINWIPPVLYIKWRNRAPIYLLKFWKWKTSNHWLPLMNASLFSSPERHFIWHWQSSAAGEGAAAEVEFHLHPTEIWSFYGTGFFFSDFFFVFFSFPP